MRNFLGRARTPVRAEPRNGVQRTAALPEKATVETNNHYQLGIAIPVKLLDGYCGRVQ